MINYKQGAYMVESLVDDGCDQDEIIAALVGALLTVFTNDATLFDSTMQTLTRAFEDEG